AHGRRQLDARDRGDGRRGKPLRRDWSPLVLDLLERRRVGRSRRAPRLPLRLFSGARAPGSGGASRRHDLPGAPDGARGARLSLRWPAVLQSARAEARRIARDPGRSTSPRDVSIWARIQWLGAAATATARLIGRREPTESSRLLEQRQGWSLGAPHALSRKADRTGRS